MKSVAEIAFGKRTSENMLFHNPTGLSSEAKTMLIDAERKTMAQDSYIAQNVQYYTEKYHNVIPQFGEKAVMETFGNLGIFLSQMSEHAIDIMQAERKRRKKFTPKAPERPLW